MAVPIVIDTDIGSDIDDLLALLYVLGRPELELVGVSTAYGDTTLRASIVHKILEWVNADVPITAGSTVTLSGKPVWYAGYEEAQARSISAPNECTPMSATDFAAQVIAPHCGNLQLLAIAPLTNLRAAPLNGAIEDEAIRSVTIMGGAIQTTRPIEHNMASDADAAAEVMSSDAAKTLIPLDQTLRIRIMRDQIHAVTDNGTLLSEFTRREVDRWMTVNETDYILVHDPLAAATISHPDEFESLRGSVSVDTSAGDHTGRTAFTEDPAGSTRIVTGYDSTSIRGLILEGIRSGLELGA